MHDQLSADDPSFSPGAAGSRCESTKNRCGTDGIDGYERDGRKCHLVTEVEKMPSAGYVFEMEERPIL
jgi:hypothetical protein